MEAVKKALDKTLAVICIGLFGFLVLLVTWQVFTRFILNNPSVFSEELAKYCFVWLVLFGAAFVFGERGHMAVEFIKNKFPTKVKLMIEILIEVITILFALTVLLIGGYLAVDVAWNQLSASLQIPVGYLYAGIPISGLFIVFYCIYNITNIIKNNKTIEQL
ncbi:MULTISPECIES: TRAP transporter small permease [Oceanobacillus]|uniref:Tripartite ATP-independent periplasmic transporters DctQ component domain-containing protein n=1 Tax=Oceanobacillus kimchii TaxID=746691 RepID=A0ABQ5TPH8_9BACI|nr:MULTISPECIES: TRAP transporter small permease [Oceanobacillus]MBT2600438.1 TRAP transporter small permease [Oceanobacillus sp. ISL-74]MBT2650596.1 TRAP transporter small permease [Oceanobacillus sp. ISL-73]MCT1578337.1 TRAP transporter small permease [Oceanobacillus kimchii]MCT2134515.1 TRAP transporter small permease [Oceanobacillus kimchii]OEH54864.1 C4-dicarboxylate ABC transporter permease [Oceanobacillus sp. E9]